MHCNSPPPMGWETPTTRKPGHVYLEWGENNIMFTKSELQRLDRFFYRPSYEKLLKHIKKAKPKKCETNDAKFQNEVSKNCDSCQRFVPKPKIFRVSLLREEDLEFGEEILMDLMRINGNTSSI